MPRLKQYVAFIRILFGEQQTKRPQLRSLSLSFESGLSSPIRIDNADVAVSERHVKFIIWRTIMIVGGRENSVEFPARAEGVRGRQKYCDAPASRFQEQEMVFHK